MWRKNRSRQYGSKCVGVDLNRNWGFRWGGESVFFLQKRGYCYREGISKVSQTFLLSGNFSVMAMFFHESENSRHKLRTYM